MGYPKYLGFSSGLMTTLTECRGQVESWAEREKKAADVMEEEYQQALEKEQSAINSLEEKLLAVRLQLGINVKEGTRVGEDAAASGGIAQRQQTLLEEKARVEAEIEELKGEMEEKSEEIELLKEQKEREEARAAEVRSKKFLAEESKNTTVEDLTRGIINYKYLGLDFEKAENQKLRFTFTQIDPERQSRKFSFVLGANDIEIYEVEDCTPPVNPGLLEEALHELNSEEDLGQFTMKMRKAFCALVSN